MKKLSFNKVLHNKKFMMVFSLVAAVAIWAAVAYGPSSTITKTIKGVPINVSLTNPLALEENLQLTGQKEFTADIQIQGPRSKVERLTGSDIILTADTADVVKPDKYTVAVKASNLPDGCEIKDTTKQTITLTCDKWVGNSFPVEADISGVKVTDETIYRLGTPMLAADFLTEGKAQVKGPSGVISKIDKLVAKVTAGEPIADAQVFSTELTAVDSEGKDVDLSECTFPDAAEGKGTVNVTVPVQVYRKVNFTYQLENVPEYYQGVTNFFTLSPTYIEFWGSPTAVESFAAQVADLGKFDFDNMKATDNEKVIPLTIPDGITVLGDVREVKAAFKLSNVSSKTMDLTLEMGTKGNVVIQNQPAGRSVTVQDKLTGIVLCGPKSALNRVRASDLVVTIDMANNATTGPSLFQARITVKNRKDIWVYYGDNKHGIDVGVTVDVA